MAPTSTARGGKTSGTLALAGARLTGPGANRGAISMHESCLREQWQIKEPAMSSIATLKASLEDDAVRQTLKYGGNEPAAMNARFNVTLPRSPQNTKYSIMSRSELNSSVEFSGLAISVDAPSTEVASAVTPRGAVKRFNVNTLRDWFCDIDADRSGSITQRELIVALRQHKGMQALFCQVSGVENGEIKMFRDTKGQDNTATQMAQTRRDEVTRIKRILDEIDTDGSGTMEWTEFVEFFRRTGLFLEYQTRESLNNCEALMSAEEVAMIEKHKVEQEESEQKAQVPRRGMTLAPNSHASLMANFVRDEHLESERESSVASAQDDIEASHPCGTD